jgi:hypothetical protein
MIGLGGISIPPNPASSSAAADYTGQLPQGILCTTPARLITASPTTVQLNAANDWVATMLVPKCAFKLTHLSRHVSAVGTQGDGTLEVYTHDAANAQPNASDQVLGTLDSGSGAGWSRLAIASESQYQFYPGRIYWIVEKGADSEDWTCTANGVTAVNGSEFPDEMPKSMISTDGGSTWTDLVDGNGRLALWNIVLNSASGHVPQALYGAVHGNKVPLPDGSTIQDNIP